MPDRGTKRARGGSMFHAGSGSRRSPEFQVPGQPVSGVNSIATHDSQPNTPGLNFIQGYSTSNPPPGKLAIQPLPRAVTQVTAANAWDKHRTSRACDKCRYAKSKCSGGQPCVRCKSEGKDCVYGEGKREIEKRESQRLTERNLELESWNRNLIHNLRFLIEQNRLVDTDLESLRALVLNAEKASSSAPLSTANLENQQVAYAKDAKKADGSPRGEDEADADVGSTGSLDVINEDTNRTEEAREAGYMGKSSAVTWIQRAKKAATGDEMDQQDAGTDQDPVNPFTESCYHAESQDFESIDDSTVDAYEWPSKNIAKNLVDSYFTFVHPCFPVVVKDQFLSSFEAYTPNRLNKTEGNQHWLCLVNIIFALGAKHAHLTNADWAGLDDDHLVYIARARVLGMDHRTFYRNPEVRQTRTLILYGLYLFASDQLNRAWVIVGVAVRNCMALGLHARSQAKGLSDAEKENRVRMWWSLFNLERSLDEVLGRPSCITEGCVCIHEPLCVDESQLTPDIDLYADQNTSNTSSSQHDSPEKNANLRNAQSAANSHTAARNIALTNSSLSTSTPSSSSSVFSSPRLPVNSSTYFVLRTQLGVISHRILAKLYSPDLFLQKWSYVQTTMQDFDAELQSWKSSLPDDFNFSLGSTADDRFVDQKTGLKIFYNSTRMTLFRCCLCQFEGRIPNESAESKAVNSFAVSECVNAAQAIIHSLPPRFDVRKLYKLQPWWTTLHYIVEAASVLMLELAYRAEHVPAKAEELLIDSKQAVFWLALMSGESVSARKAWEIFNELILQVAPRVGGEVSDLPTEARCPPGWCFNRFGTGPKHAHDGKSATSATSTHSHPAGSSSVMNSSNNSWDFSNSSAPRYPGPMPGSDPKDHSIPSYMQYRQTTQPFAFSGQLYGVFDPGSSWGAPSFPGTPSMTQYGWNQMSTGTPFMAMQNLSMVDPLSSVAPSSMEVLASLPGQSFHEYMDQYEAPKESDESIQSSDEHEAEWQQRIGIHQTRSMAEEVERQRASQGRTFR